MNQSDISGEQQAQEQFGTASRAAAFHANQVLDHLNGPMQQFIARQEMAFIATASASGACDCSFRAGTRGFVAVLNEKTLVYPEYRGNGVLASVGNIMENPHIGMIFLDYYLTTMGLHVNGKAHILTPSEMEGMPHLPASILESMQIKGGRRPEAWILVNVEEAYVHCSKHVPLMKRLDKHIAWGSDDEFVKGGDYFRVKKEPKP